MVKRLVIFLTLNFLALAIGGYFTGDGVPSNWYQNLNKAPWTPPGWVFGAAWTTIMICFAVFMSKLHQKSENKNSILVLYGVQLVLNVVWNPIFFYFRDVTMGLVVISALTLLVFYFLFGYWRTIKAYSLLVLPYALWLSIATSLNLYILLYN